jgi:hypothetical protein
VGPKNDDDRGPLIVFNPLWSKSTKSSVYLVTGMSSMEELATATSGMFLHMTLTSMGKVGGREGGSEVASLLPEILHTTDTLFPAKNVVF